MNKHLKNLNRIEFVITSACTGKCKHCSQGEHKSSDNIDKESAVAALRKIASVYNIDSVMTFGGEPLLYPETVCEIHKTARALGISKRQLITNGYFSKDTDRIRYIADLLTESGVNEVLLSVDAFHQETIPLEYVRKFAERIKENDVKILMHPAWLVSADADNPFNNKTRDILALFYESGFESSEGNIIFPMGNALVYLKEYLDTNEKKKNPYEENPEDIRAICFSANGDILGSNFYKKDINDILSDYKP